MILNYYDINDKELDPELINDIKKRNFPYPLTLINGKAISAGFISFYDIAIKVDDIFREQAN